MKTEQTESLTDFLRRIELRRAEIRRELERLEQFRTADESQKSRDFARGAIFGVLWAIENFRTAPSDVLRERAARARRREAGDEPNVAPEADAPLRHLVYQELLAALPLASAEQGKSLRARLNLPKNVFADEFRFLRVSPELNETDTDDARMADDIAREMAAKFGDALGGVPGFYHDGFEWLLALPPKCFFLTFKDSSNLIRAIVCLPASRTDGVYFPLSSSKYDGGAKACALPKNLFQLS